MGRVFHETITFEVYMFKGSKLEKGVIKTASDVKLMLC